ncbi:hypothetical protein F5Y18DRAFT_442365 [Xylariaceae sp. FL1019]|nr:hypothetical protein F5Y18DRAFT_442365 [Xylariaceae sp. FL1019]
MCINKTANSPLNKRISNIHGRQHHQHPIFYNLKPLPHIKHKLVHLITKMSDQQLYGLQIDHTYHPYPTPSYPPPSYQNNRYISPTPQPTIYYHYNPYNYEAQPLYTNSRIPHLPENPTRSSHQARIPQFAPGHIRPPVHERNETPRNENNRAERPRDVSRCRLRPWMEGIAGIALTALLAQYLPNAQNDAEDDGVEEVPRPDWV